MLKVLDLKGGIQRKAQKNKTLSEFVLASVRAMQWTTARRH